MNFDDKITMTALKFVCGEKTHVCRLCFAITEDGEVSIEDNVRVQTFYNTETIAFNSMFRELGISLETRLPNFICMSCAQLIINSYNFQKLCIYSNQKWIEVIDRLNDSLARSEMIGDNIKSVYLMINKKDNVMFTNKREPKQVNKRTALSKVREVIRNKKKYSMEKDKEINYKCKHCGQRFKSRVLYLRHIRGHTKTHNPCKKCSKVFSTPDQLKDHEERIHQPKRIQCTKCFKMFSTEKLLRVHFRMKHIKATCKLCSIQMPSHSDLRTHMDKHWVTKCPQCSKNYYNRNSFNYHLKTCGKEEKDLTFTCDVCKKIFSRNSTLQTHRKIEHGFGNVHVCKWCDKKFDALSKLKSHEVTHTGEKNFPCNICDGKFVSQSALLYHKRLHTGEKPYACEFCDERFVSASRRLTHTKRKHLEPTLECHICHMKFAMGNTLRKHIHRHSMPNSRLYIPQEE